MPGPNVFVNHVDGDFLPAIDWDNSFALVETSFLDLGSFVASGLVLSIGSGLSVNITAGHAIIGADITYASGTASGLTNSTVNHVFCLQNGTFTSNTSGTPPANSAKLGTCVTSGGVVTSVAMGRTSGRQQFVQLQNLVPGGPSAGTASAGHPDGINLASWGASDAEGQALYGVLPAGAVPGILTAPVTVQISDAATSTQPTALTIQHRTSGTPTTSFGSTVLISADNASNALTDQLVINALWSAATAGAENSLAIFSIRRAGVDVETMRLNPNGNGRLQATQDFFHAASGGSVGFFGTTPVAQQPGASAAGIAAVTDSAAKVALTALQAALHALGLITAPA